MEDLTDIVAGISNKRVKELAIQIRDEMKALIYPHNRSGKAYNSIQIHWNTESPDGEFASGAEGDVRGGFITHVWIGSTERSAYYLDQGNNADGDLIYPTDSPQLRFKESRPGHKARGYRFPFVHSYEGIHYTEEVADRHR